MTLGQKLSAYRKVAGMTQQQLGELLNISAQAVSKWENDQAEPDLATVRALADIYKISVDTLLNAEDVPVAPADEGAHAEENERIEKSETVLPIGYCKNCGIAVGEENLGADTPVILCKKCHEAEKLAKARETVAKQRAIEERQRQEQAVIAENRHKCKKRFILSTVIAAIAAVLFLCIYIGVSEEFNFFVALIGIYVVFAFASCLFYDCLVQEVVVNWFEKSFQAPGLIITLDMDGCLFYLGMKLIFWVIGLIFGLVAGTIGVLIGLVCAPFNYPFVMRQLRRDYKEGVECDLL
ncbi:MAG: helix-turn-helix transcriptional regulator [Clostridia bacterium]|nr:helix-turn-helix transcriptional regulator [Clostridia bacterium]